MIMVITKQGTVQGSSIVLTEPPDLPEGTKVTVTLEPMMEKNLDINDTTLADQANEPEQNEDRQMEDRRKNWEELKQYFGIWKDREDIGDGAEWVRKQRAQWSERLKRNDS